MIEKSQEESSIDAYSEIDEVEDLDFNTAANK